MVEDNDKDRQAIVELIGNGDVEVTAVGTGAAGLAELQSQKFDCLILDLKLLDISGFEVLEEMQKLPELLTLPVIVYTGQDLTEPEDRQLRKLAKAVIIKDVRSPERLLDETTLFLHRVASRLPETQRRMLEKLYNTDTALEGKKILMVDDDARNVFALTSLLERHKIEVLAAYNGKEAIETLRKTSGIDAVLMDIMMPEMDGYETIRAIRRKTKFKKLPIIALTAKAMKGDREKCIEAGASDYIAKPVNAEQLLSLLRVWLFK